MNEERQATRAAKTRESTKKPEQPESARAPFELSSHVWGEHHPTQAANLEESTRIFEQPN